MVTLIERNKEREREREKGKGREGWTTKNRRRYGEISRPDYIRW